MRDDTVSTRRIRSAAQAVAGACGARRIVSAHGSGCGAAAGLAAAVRGWLRRRPSRAGQLLQQATSEFGHLAAVITSPEGRDPSPPGPTGPVPGYALSMVAACAHAATAWQGRRLGDLEALLGRFGLAAALAPGG